MADTERPDIKTTILVMIREQGNMWAESIDVDRRDIRNAVVITDTPEYCYRLTLNGCVWTPQRDALTVEEIGEFFTAFGTHWHMLRGALLSAADGCVRIRAFTKNTRMVGGWSGSAWVRFRVSTIELVRGDNGWIYK